MTDNHIPLLCEHSHCSWRWEASKDRIRQNLWENQDQSQNTRLRGHSDSFVLCWHLILHDFLFYCSIKMSSKPLPRNPLGVFSAHTVLLFCTTCGAWGRHTSFVRLLSKTCLIVWYDLKSRLHAFHLSINTTRRGLLLSLMQTTALHDLMLTFRHIL